MTGGRQAPLRTFFALWPDPAVRAGLAARAAQVARTCAGRPPRAEALH